MKLKLGVTHLAILALSLFLIGCSSAAPASEPFQAPPEVEQPTPTVPPEKDKEAGRQFAAGHRAISEEWDQFHQDFDAWRAGLVACQSSTLQTSLRHFVSQFNPISDQARGLPRPTVARDLADKAIDAADVEAAALRQLRDDWQPDDPSTFEAVDLARSKAAALLNEVEDDMADLRESADPASRAPVEKFVAALETIGPDWDGVHDSYKSFKSDAPDLSAAEVQKRIEALLEELGPVAEAIDGLPRDKATRSAARELAKAADAEAKALEDLQEAAAESDGGEPANGESTEESAPRLSFSDLDDAAENSEEVQAKAIDDLQEVLDSAPEENLKSVDEFEGPYEEFLKELADFHKGYNDWRRDEGGCNRAEAIETLGDFSLQFAGLARRVSLLEGATFLQPAKQVVVDAARMEEQALRELGNSWRPFSGDAYSAFDRERESAQDLRRRVDIQLSEIEQRLGISAEESGG